MTSTSEWEEAVMDDSQDEREGSQDDSASPMNADGSRDVTDTASGDTDRSQHEREGGSQDGSASSVNAEDHKEVTDTATGEADEGQGSEFNPKRPRMDESASTIYSFDRVCEILKEDALTVKRLIIYHQLHVEFHDLDFGHILRGPLDEWPHTEATHAIMIRRSDVETLKSLLSAHSKEPNVVMPDAPPTAQNLPGTMPSSVEPPRTRGRDKSYPIAEQICMRLLREDYKRGRAFRSARELHERVVKKLKANAPSERSISRWTKSWIQEIKKDA